MVHTQVVSQNTDLVILATLETILVFESSAMFSFNDWMLMFLHENTIPRSYTGCLIMGDTACN